MDSVQWIFSGIGTQIFTNLVSLFIGGVIGYRIRDKQIGKQKQIAGDSANQRQELHMRQNSCGEKCGRSSADKDSHQMLNQEQEAGDNSTQVQIGDINEHNGR